MICRVWHVVVAYVPHGSEPSIGNKKGEAKVLCSYESEAEAMRPHAVPARDGMDAYMYVFYTSCYGGLGLGKRLGSEETSSVLGLPVDMAVAAKIGNELMRRHVEAQDSAEQAEDADTLESAPPAVERQLK